MKKSMKTTLGAALVLCAVIFSLGASAQRRNLFPEEMTGKWIVTIENPQTSDTMKGTCIIARSEGDTRATFDIAELGSIETTPFKSAGNGRFLSEFETGDGYLIDIEFSVVDGKLTCGMEAGGFFVPVALQRED